MSTHTVTTVLANKIVSADLNSFAVGVCYLGCVIMSIDTV